MIRGSVAGSLMWSLPTTPQMTVVGQNAGTLTATASTSATVHVSGGDVYLRGLTITGGSPGLWANSGAIVRLDHVNVSNNTAGGILLDGAGFDIKNVTVNNNSLMNGASGIWGGIRIQTSTTPRTLSLSTITGNSVVGVSCDASTALSPVPTSVLVTAPSGAVDIAATCGSGFTSCGTTSATCGAQL
jgi:hypothetical protein